MAACVGRHGSQGSTAWALVGSWTTLGVRRLLWCDTPTGATQSGRGQLPWEKRMLGK